MANVYIDAKDDHKKDEEQVETEEQVEETCECVEEDAEESCDCEKESEESEDESCECEDESEEATEDEESAEEEASEDKKDFDYILYGKETVDETKKMAENLINDVVSTLKLKQNDWNKTLAEYKSNKPPVDLLEYEEELVIKVDLPRVSKEDIDVKMSSDSVEIEVDFPDELESEEDVKVLRRERCAGKTKNIIVLPVEVDIQDVTASFEDHLLTITLPKIKGRKVDVEIV